VNPVCRVPHPSFFEGWDSTPAAWHSSPAAAVGLLPFFGEGADRFLRFLS
jgi:hypothetical protein